MANIKAMKKDIKRNAKKRLSNTEAKSAAKTYIKKVRVACNEERLDDAKTALSRAVKALDKAVQRGIIHKNQAARRKSRVAKLVQSGASAN